MNIETAKLIISKYLNSNEFEEIEIDFFGGEPFIEFKKIRAICEWTWSKKWKNRYIFFATTNGILVQGEIKEWLRQHKTQFWVSLSLDGKRKSHNINRSNSFDKIDINFFKETWPTQTIKMTISKQTVENIFENIVYLHSLGFDITGTNFAEGIDWEDEKYVKIVSSQLEQLCKFYIEHKDLKPVPLINMAIHKCAEGHYRKKWCGCGEFMAAYDTDGKKYPCTFITPMTFNKKFLNTIQSINYKDIDIFIDEECYNNCYLEPICNSCYGANLLSNSKINIRDKSKCALTKIRAVYTAALKAHKIINNPENSYINRKTVEAISKINELYNKEL